MQRQADDSIDDVALTTLLVNVALIGGVVVFAVVTLAFLQPQAQPNPVGQPGVVTWVSAAAGIIAIVFSSLLFNMVMRNTVAAVVRGELMTGASVRRPIAARLQVGVMLSTAILEGAAFLALVAYLIEAHWLSLAVAGVLGMVMLWRLAFPSRMSGWVDAIQAEAQDEGQFASR